MKSADEKLETLQQRLGYHYKDLTLLQSALTHPSFFRHQAPLFPLRIHFQRLEFLGDRVLSALLGRKLFDLFPNQREGFLSRAYMALARGKSLVLLAKDLGLPEYLKVHTPLVDSILEDAMEALIGSLWLDSDYETTQACILNWFGNIKEKMAESLGQLNKKGQLQELMGDHMHDIRYELVKEWGLEHQRKFRMAVYLKDRFLAQAEASSKQEAGEKAAAKALKILSELENYPSGKESSCTQESRT